LDDKKTLLAILLFALCLVVFQAFFKPPIDNDAVNKLKSHFQFQGRYIGTYAPDFEVKSLDGETFRLSQQLGTNVIVLNFFTTWCGPCQREMDEFEYFVKKTKDQPIVFLAINVGEDRAQVKAFIKEEKISLRIALDRQKEIAAIYRIRAFPTTILINPEGRIMLYEVGAIANADVTLMPMINTFTRTLEKKGFEYNLDEYRKNARDRLPDMDETGKVNIKTDHSSESTNTVPEPQDEQEEEE